MAYTGSLDRPDYYSLSEMPTVTKTNMFVSSTRSLFEAYEQHQHSGGNDGCSTLTPQDITMCGNLNLNSNWLSKDGTNCGIFICGTGVGINTNSFGNAQLTLGGTSTYGICIGPASCSIYIPGNPIVGLCIANSSSYAIQVSSSNVGAAIAGTNRAIWALGGNVGICAEGSDYAVKGTGAGIGVYGCSSTGSCYDFYGAGPQSYFTKVGIGTDPIGTLSVKGCVQIGSSFIGYTPPADGLIIQGKTGMKQCNPGSLLHIGMGVGATPTWSCGMVIENNGDNGIEFIGTTTACHGLYFSDSSAGQGKVMYNHTGDVLSISSAGSTILRSNGCDAICITSTGGYIGIGTGSASAKIDIYASNAYNQLILRNCTTSFVNADIGAKGSIMWGEDGGTFYLYVRTASGGGSDWKRIAMSAF